MAETVEQVYGELIDASGSENPRGSRARG
jgi:hypothetical protein